MINLEFGEIRLCLISETDLEMICRWRNSSHVRSQMRYTNLISFEDQKTWFNELDKTRNLYFKITADKIPIGVVNLKNIDWKNGTAEAGIFIGEESYLSSVSPYIAVIVLMDFAFDLLKFNELSATIKNDNLNGLKFNLSLGYKLNKKNEDGFDDYSCLKNDFDQLPLLRSGLFSNRKIKLNMGIDSRWILDKTNLNPEKFLVV